MKKLRLTVSNDRNNVILENEEYRFDLGSRIEVQMQFEDLEGEDIECIEEITVSSSNPDQNGKKDYRRIYDTLTNGDIISIEEQIN